MSKNVDYFINEITEKIYESGFPFICWEQTLGRIDVQVRDHDGNRVSQHFDRWFIHERVGKREAHYVAEMIVRRFKEKAYDKPYEFDVDKWIRSV